MTTPLQRPAHVAHERLVALQVQTSRNLRFEQEQLARRRAARLVGWLGTIAGALAIYDLLLLATAGPH